MQKYVQQLQQQKDNNPHVTHEFESTIKKWVEIDNQIKKANEAIKILKDEQKQLGAVVITYIKKNNLENHDIGLGNEGKIKLALSNRTASITRKYIEERLTKYFNSASKAKEVTEFIYADRTKTQSEYISRSKKKS